MQSDADVRVWMNAHGRAIVVQTRHTDWLLPAAGPTLRIDEEDRASEYRKEYQKISITQDTDWVEMFGYLKYVQDKPEQTSCDIVRMLAIQAAYDDRWQCGTEMTPRQMRVIMGIDDDTTMDN